MKLSFLCFTIITLLPAIARSELLFDPMSLKTEPGQITMFAGTSLINETEYDLSVFGLNVKTDIERQPLELSGAYSIKDDIGVYASIQYNIGADISVAFLDAKHDLDGYQLAFGAFLEKTIFEDYPSFFWFELNSVKEDYSEPTEKGKFSATELALGVMFRLLDNNQIKLSAGPELLLSSDGKVRNTSVEFNDFTNEFETEVETFDLDRDLLGLKAIASYELSNELTVFGQLSVLNETRLAISIGKQF